MDLTRSVQAALLAGVISFLSPCVLPLVPSYLCFITGATLDELSERGRRFGFPAAPRPSCGAVFVLGFSTVFVTLGASASCGRALLRESSWACYVASRRRFIMLMGLHFIGRVQDRPAAPRSALPSPFTTGGPSGRLWHWAGLCLWLDALHRADPRNNPDDCRERTGCGARCWPACASIRLGLGIPFLLAAAGVGTFLGFSGYFKRHLVTVERVMGGCWC